jgi:parvulin-like peptidyl-prolyl isomerase
MNNVDGIKKISEEELKQRREIILGMIGEDAQIPKPKNKKAKGFLYGRELIFTDRKKIDGLLPSAKPPLKNVSRQLLEEAQKKHLEKQRKDWQAEARKNELVGDKVLSEIVVGPKKIPKNNFVKKQEKKIIPNKKPPKKILKTAKKNIIKLNSIKIFFQKILTNIKIIFQKIVFILIASVLIGGIVYFLLFLLFIYEAGNNQFGRFAERYLPVPAMIIGDKFVDFYTYYKFKNQFGEDEIGVKKELIRAVLLERFFVKYQTRDRLLINKAVFNDSDANKASLGRIKKIKSLIGTGENFDQVAGKYSDKRGSIDLLDEDFFKYEYGEEIKKLTVGDVSDIITADGGYYIFKGYKKDDSLSGFSYLFVKAKNFDEYIDELVRSVYFVSFVK